MPPASTATIYDCGSKLGFLMANLAYALDREDLAGPLRREIEGLLRNSRRWSPERAHGWNRSPTR